MTVEVAQRNWLPERLKVQQRIAVCAVQEFDPENKPLLTALDFGISYGEIADKLRTRPPEVQKSILGKIFGPEGLEIPNSDRVSGFLVTLNNTPFFEPVSTQPTEVDLNDGVKLYYVALNLDSVPTIRMVNADSDYHNSQRRCTDSAANKAYQTAHTLVKQRLLSGKARDMKIIAGSIAQHIASFSLPERMAKINNFISIYQDGPPNYTNSLGEPFAAAGRVAAKAVEWLMVEEDMAEAGYVNGIAPEIAVNQFYSKGLWPMDEVDGKFEIYKPPFESFMLGGPPPAMHIWSWR